MKQESVSCNSGSKTRKLKGGIVMRLRKKGREYYEIYRVTARYLWVRKIKDPMWDVVTMKGCGIKWR